MIKDVRDAFVSDRLSAML